jgi:hypothetical protein
MKLKILYLCVLLMDQIVITVLQNEPVLSSFDVRIL